MNIFQVQFWRSFYSSTTGYTISWLLVYVLTLSLASVIFLYEIPLPENKLTVTDVEFSLSDTNHPNHIPNTIWKKTRLPDDWRNREIKAYNTWYRANLDLNVAPNRLWAVLIPALKSNAAIFLNGDQLGNGGQFSDPVSRNWMTPLLFSIPNGLLRPGNNVIHVRVKSDPAGSGQLSALQFGPYEDMLRTHQTHTFFRITSIQIITTMLLIMGGLITILWLVRRKESYYGYYGLAVIIWALHNFNIFIVDIPVSTRLWDWLSFTSIGYYAFVSVIFIHRFLEQRRPITEFYIISTGVIASIILLFVNDGTFYEVIFSAWYPAIFTVGFYVLACTCLAAWKKRSLELQLLTAAGVTTLLYAGHDLMLMHNYANWEDGYFIQYAAAALLTLFSLILLRRFSLSLKEVDHLNHNLEKRIEQKRIKLEENYHRLQSLENDRVLAEERDRLTRDMHDGMGGHLVSTLAMIEGGNFKIQNVTDAIKGSLDDLRMMIDSMDVKEDDLESVLGMFRSRISPKLKSDQMTVSWKVDDLPDIPNFGPREALNILRILQEAVTNILKHTKANIICISAETWQLEKNKSVVKIQVSDNGSGLGKSYQTGHGLNNMKRRGRTIGGNVEITSSKQGTQVTLTLPF